MIISVVELNVTELCNLTCNFCPRSQGYPNQNLHMEIETAKEICQQVIRLKTQPIIVFSGRSEPTLCKNFREIAGIFLDKNIPCKLHTNGYNLELYKDVIDHFDKVIYDVYSNKVEDFEEAIFETTKFKCEMTIHQRTADALTARTYHSKQKEIKNTMKNFAVNRAGYMSSYDSVNRRKIGRCQWLDNNVFINWNGDYNLCCQDWSTKKIANIFEQTIEDYFYNNKMVLDYRKGIASNKRLNPCKECSY